MMDAQIKKRWLHALRSGEYAQTQGYLNIVEQVGERPVGYCCLGVLCDLAEKAGVVTSAVVPSDEAGPGYREYRGTIPFDRSCGALPDEVARWAGLIDEDGTTLEDPVVPDGNNSVISLSSLNDGLDWPFAQIADAIEQHL